MSGCLRLATCRSAAGSLSLPESAARLQDRLIVVWQGRSGSKGQHPPPPGGDDGCAPAPSGGDLRLEAPHTGGDLRLEAPPCAGLRTAQTSAEGARPLPGGRGRGHGGAWSPRGQNGASPAPVVTKTAEPTLLPDFQSSRTSQELHGLCFLSLDGHAVGSGWVSGLLGQQRCPRTYLALLIGKKPAELCPHPRPLAWEGEAVGVGRAQGQARWGGRLACLAGRSEGRGAGWE